MPQGKEEGCGEPYNWKPQVFWHFIKTKSQDLFQAGIRKAFPDHTGEQCTYPMIERAKVKSMVQVLFDVVRAEVTNWRCGRRQSMEPIFDLEKHVDQLP